MAFIILHFMRLDAENMTQIQRTPMINRSCPSFAPQQGSAWTPQHLLAQVQHGQPQTNKNHRQAFGLSDYSYRGTISEQSESASEVENLLVPKRLSVRANNQGWAGSGQRSRTNQHGMRFLGLKHGTMLMKGFSSLCTHE